ncbi:MAG: isoprenylcysteine carboxylmethyltransferase family protein [Saprospiraceae bacterium]
MSLFYFGLALICYFALHSWWASDSFKAKVIPRWIPAKFYRLCYNGMALGLLIFLGYLANAVESVLIFQNRLLTIIAIVPMLVGVFFLVKALQQYNLSEFSGVEQLQTSNSKSVPVLQTNGLNAIVRHPLYFATLILIWSFFLFRPTMLVLVGSSITSIYIYLGTKLEEQKLVNIFGESYRQYQQTVPMLLPKFKDPRK